MTLPNLPKLHKQKEAKFGIQLRRYLEQNPQESCALELKQTETDSIPFSCVTDEQISYALRVKQGELIRVIGLNGQPDYIWCNKMPAYICIRFPTFFCLIDIDDFIKEKDGSKRKSLTVERAKIISSKVIDL